MFGFWFLIAALILSLVFATFWLRNLRKTYPNATVVDKEIWKIQMITSVIAFLMVGFAAQISFAPHTYDIDEDARQERKIEKLIDNDKLRTESARRSQYASLLLFALIGSSLAAIGGSLGKLQRARKTELLSDNPETKKPLGLS